MKKRLLYPLLSVLWLMSACGSYMPATRGWAGGYLAEMQVQIEGLNLESQRHEMELGEMRRRNVSEADLDYLRGYIDRRLAEIADAEATAADHQALADRLRDISRQLRDLSQQFYASEQEGAEALDRLLDALKNIPPTAAPMPKEPVGY